MREIHNSARLLSSRIETAAALCLALSAKANDGSEELQEALDSLTSKLCGIRDDANAIVDAMDDLREDREHEISTAYFKMLDEKIARDEACAEGRKRLRLKPHEKPSASKGEFADELSAA